MRNHRVFIVYKQFTKFRLIFHNISIYLYVEKENNPKPNKGVKIMKTTAKNARKEMIKLVSEKGITKITNGDITNLEKQGYTFRELTAALRWLTYSPQMAKYRA